MCTKFPKLCNNFLDQIGCANSSRLVKGCNPSLDHWQGSCKCLGEPIYQDRGSRISKELIDNRIKGDVGWMLEPWASGPPYNFDLSCKYNLYILSILYMPYNKFLTHTIYSDLVYS